MSVRLKELQEELAAVSRRLEGLAGRLEALRASTGEPPPGASAAAPLFRGLAAGAGPLDDVELHFEVLDTEDPGREGR